MLAADVIVAGGGVAGLLLASALAPESSVVLLEHRDAVPRNKYWLTDGKAARAELGLVPCIDRYYDFLDFVAYDGLTATVSGRYCLWDTEKLIGQLEAELRRRAVRVLTGHRLYSVSMVPNGIVVRANAETIHARLLVDCMGFGSPLVGAKNVATILGYYLLHGREVATSDEVRPVALDNIMIDRRPTFFELFPTSKGTAHAALIVPARHHNADRSIKGELSFILRKSHYSALLAEVPALPLKSYFGIVPVGRLHSPALDRIVFFGEAGQTNPAASATGLTRILRTYRELAESLHECLRHDELGRAALLRALPSTMTRMNRVFQECLFESLLSFTSDDFRRLVSEIHEYPDDLINDLIFAEFDFRGSRTIRLAFDALVRRHGVLGRHVVKSFLRWFSRRALR